VVRLVVETGCVGCAEVAVGAVDTVTSCEEVMSDVVLAGGADRVGGDVVWGGGSSSVARNSLSLALAISLSFLQSS
jgi:hypothetical protein